jgi:hypothetical protein
MQQEVRLGGETGFEGDSGISSWLGSGLALSLADISQAALVTQGFKNANGSFNPIRPSAS